MSVRVPLGDLRHIEFNAAPEVEMRHFRTRPDLWQTPIKLWRDPDGVLRLTDGWHRLTHARQTGQGTIAVEITL